jgi:hypothetical protein
MRAPNVSRGTARRRCGEVQDIEVPPNADSLPIDNSTLGPMRFCLVERLLTGEGPASLDFHGPGSAAAQDRCLPS